MARNGDLELTLRALEQQEYFTVKQLAVKFGCSTRTIKRHLEKSGCRIFASKTGGIRPVVRIEEFMRTFVRL